jgi:SAM-dependent methyltransferase
VVCIDPLPSDEELKVYYASYARNDDVDLSRKWISNFPRLRKAFHWLSGDVDPREFVKLRGGDRVLDYGCGQAHYLRDFHDQGVAISGAEIAEYIVTACQGAGLDVHHVPDFSTIPFKDSEFDVIYLMQVFEHLRDPHQSMEELARILKPGGSLYLAVPNSASIWRQTFGSNWVSGWFAPFHLFHYNVKAFGYLAHQHHFQVVDSWSRTPASWFRLNLKAWIHERDNQIEWRKSWLDSRLAKYSLMFLLRIIEIPFRERDCLVVHMKRGENK